MAISGVPAGSSQSQSQSTSNSNSSSFIPGYAEEPFLNSIAQYAGQVGSNVYNWAQGEYAKNSALTDANIHNYLNTSAQSLGMANNDLNRYEQKFQPEEDQLLADANSYASNNRKLFEMGAAESGQAQAGDAARKNAERDLQSYGVDPSAGRYEALDRASTLSTAAASAGAAQMARQNTEQVGRDLRDKAIAVGAQYPGRISNSMNTALQGFAGAENAGLANANTGVALQGAANPFLATASSLKYPPLGNQSSSATQSTSDSASQAYPPTSGGGGGKSPTEPTSNSGASPSGGGGGSRYPSSGSGPGTPGGEINVPSSGVGSSYDGLWDGSGSGTDMSGYGDNPFSSAYGDGSIGGSYDPTSDASLSSYSNGSFGDASGYTDAGNYTAPSDTYDMGGAYAQGGAIPDDGDEAGGIPQDGGSVPQSASPSGGRMVDDVQAQGPQGGIHVNADEFVIPRDVALWKGQEFFQKLITQSRQARIMAPAHPSQGAPAPAQNMR